MAASWVKPAANAVVKAYRLTFAAKTAGGSAAEVAFKVEWSGGSFAGCSTTKSTTDGTWSCTADLLRLGVPPGKLKLSFDIVDAAGRVATDSAPARSITYAVVPPRPETSYTHVSTTFRSDDSTVEVDKITWTEPEDYATEFRLYGVIGCLNYSKARQGQPCLVERMQLPAKSLKLIKTVDGTTRSIVLRHTIPPEGCSGPVYVDATIHAPSLWCSPFGALVLGASNAYGQSIFAIPISMDVCYECP